MFLTSEKQDLKTVLTNIHPPYKSWRRNLTCHSLDLSASFLPGKTDSYAILINGRKAITISSWALRSTCRGLQVVMTVLSGESDPERYCLTGFSFAICLGNYWPSQSSGIKTIDLGRYSFSLVFNTMSKASHNYAYFLKASQQNQLNKHP